MHILEHLFLVGEFPARAHLLSGLTLEQVTLCPDGVKLGSYLENQLNAQVDDPEVDLPDATPT